MNDIKVKVFPKNFRSMTKSEFDPNIHWYVWIDVFCPEIGQKKQFRYKKGINEQKNLEERRSETAALFRAVTYNLSIGWNPFTKEIVNDDSLPPVTLILESLDYFFEIKTPPLRPRSKTTYKSIIAIFKRWLIANNYKYTKVNKFGIVDAQKYMDYLTINRKNSGKTYNNNLLGLRSIFNFLMDRELIEKNPFKKIKKQQVERGKNTAYSLTECKKIDEYFKQNNLRLYYFKEFIYCAAIRRTELTLLKVKDILDDSIIIRSEISKNKKQENAAINKKLKLIIEEMELHKYNSEDFLFGKKLETCATQFPNPNHISNMHQKALIHLEIRKECTLYSWKHTGAVNLYKATKDPYLVMRHLRHHSLEMTMIYLKSLGINSNDSLKDLNW